MNLFETVAAPGLDASDIAGFRSGGADLSQQGPDTRDFVARGTTATEVRPHETHAGMFAQPDITPLLAVLKQFHPLNPGIEAYLAEHVRSFKARKRKLLQKEGQPCEQLYFIVKGAIRAFRREGQKDITTWINVEDHLVSPMFAPGRLAASLENIQTLENSELLVLRYDDLETLYQLYPETNLLARRVLQVYYADAEKRAFIARLTKAENRYRYFLVQHQPLVNRIPLKYIASYLGMTLETLSRVRKRFAAPPAAAR